jgi:hypothetical protein
MLFTALDGRLLLACHAPNTTPRERPHFHEVVEHGATLKLSLPRTPLRRLFRLFGARA